MTDIEKQVLLKLMKDIKEMKENMKYLVDAMELLVKIESESVKNGKR